MARNSTTNEGDRHTDPTNSGPFSATPMQYSVVIPAYNEGKVIERCLRAIFDKSLPGELEVIVVCNGCTDSTPEIARSFSPQVRVIETPTPSKSNALNLGDDAASYFPRFYVDADVVFTIEDIRQVATAITNEGFLFAAPMVTVDSTNCSWSVTAYYNTWMRLPHVRYGMIGSGVYAISKMGRQRFHQFPDLVSDDGYARLVFNPRERKPVESAHSIITPPTTIRGVYNIKVRSFIGTYQLRSQYPDLCERRIFRWRRVPMRSFLCPVLWPSIAVYIFVSVTARWVAMRRFQKTSEVIWLQDVSSRDQRFNR